MVHLSSFDSACGCHLLGSWPTQRGVRFRTRPYVADSSRDRAFVLALVLQQGQSRCPSAKVAAVAQGSGADVRWRVPSGGSEEPLLRMHAALGANRWEGECLSPLTPAVTSAGRTPRNRAVLRTVLAGLIPGWHSTLLLYAYPVRFCNVCYLVRSFCRRGCLLLCASDEGVNWLDGGLQATVKRQRIR